MPSLIVTKQTAISEDKVTTRGKTHHVYVVVKKSPFQVPVALKNCSLSLKQLAFDITLIYDMPDYNKEVAYVSTKPVDYKSCINDLGDEITFDPKISALSSQHEDSFFRLKICVYDPSNMTAFPRLTAITYPIKVISKPISQRKQRKKSVSTPARRNNKTYQKPTELENPSPIVPYPSHPDTMYAAPGSEISPLSIQLFTKLDSQQRETMELLRQLLAVRQNEPPSEPPLKRQKHTTEGGELDNETRLIPTDFEGAFSVMLQAYSIMSTEQKAETTRKVMRTLSVRDSEQLEELVDVMGMFRVRNGAQGLLVPFRGFTHEGLCGASHVPECVQENQNPELLDTCLYRTELARIDQFYNEVFF